MPALSLEVERAANAVFVERATRRLDVFAAAMISGLDPHRFDAIERGVVAATADEITALGDVFGQDVTRRLAAAVEHLAVVVDARGRPVEAADDGATSED